METRPMHDTSASAAALAAHITQRFAQADRAQDTCQICRRRPVAALQRDARGNYSGRCGVCRMPPALPVASSSAHARACDRARLDLAIAEALIEPPRRWAARPVSSTVHARACARSRFELVQEALIGTPPQRGRRR